jgi:hypothetical protein
MTRIRKREKKHQGKIPEKTDVATVGLNFSFKYLELQKKPRKFSLEYTGDGYTETLLQRLKDMSGLSVPEFMHSRSLRTHPIDFSKTSQPQGFSHLPDQLRDKEPWQFQLTGNEHGRVHGLLIDETFYLVWLDPSHKLYSKK